MNAPKAALLAIGDELLSGRTVNTNAAWIGVRLRDMGFVTVAGVTLPDEPQQIVASLLRRVGEVDLVVAVGGLGPTPDDLTRDAVAYAAGVSLVEDADVLADIRRRTGGRAPERNARMASFPEGATVYANPIGSAAAFSLAIGEVPVFVLPGPPLEVEAVWDAVDAALRDAFPKLRQREACTVRVFGPHEAELAQQLGDLLDRGGEPIVGVTAREGILTVTVSGPGAKERADAIRAVAGADVLPEGCPRPVDAAFRSLKEGGWSVAVAESLTGGLVASDLVSIPSASDVFRGGVVAYPEEIKRDLLGVPAEVLKSDGPVSEACVRALAEGARTRLGADVGLATTGVAGPDPDPHGAEPGLVFLAMAGPADGAAEVVQLQLGGGRNRIRRRAAHSAWDLVRRRLS